MRLSIALCTRNGTRYLREQLASLAAQDRPADEVIVCDDASTDDTAALVRAQAAALHLPIQLLVNPAQLGVVPNFAQAIAAATGDVIALADQDDVWRRDKLARFEQLFTARPEVALAFSDALVFRDTPDRPSHRLWDALGFRPALRRHFDRGAGWRTLLKFNVITGATVAFRRELRDLALPIAPGWMHDYWLGLLAAATGAVAAIPEPLIWYRQHPGQQIGGAKLSWRRQLVRARQMDAAYFASLAQQCDAAAGRLAERGGPAPSARVRVALRLKAEHLRRRAALPPGRLARLGFVCREAVNYRRFGRGWRSAAQDLVLR